MASEERTHAWSSLKISSGEHGKDLQRPTSSLARKVFLALSGLVIITGLCGGVALSFFYRIELSVSVLSTVATPLLIESMALKNNADRMRSVLLDGPEDEREGNLQFEDIARLDAEGHQHAKNLEELASNLGLREQFEVVQHLQDDFRSTLEDMVHAQARRAIATRAVLNLYNDIHSATEAAESGLEGIARPGDGPLPTDAVSDEVDKAVRQFGNVPDMSVEVYLIGGALDLDRFESSATAFFQGLDASLDRVRALADEGGRKLDFAPVARAFAQLKAHFLAPHGVIDRKRQLLTSIAIFNARSKRLSELLLRYNDVLSGVETAVRNAKDQSRAQTASTISVGLIAVATLVGLSVLLAIGAAIFLTRSISSPLVRLTAHLHGMRARAELTEIVDPSLLNTSDELGQLSSAFNHLIRELAAARAALIAKSEAEISKQVDRLEAAVGNMSQGLCMYDRSQRLIISNARYAEIYGIPPEQIRPGMSLREVLELRLAHDGYYGEADSYVSRRLGVCRDDKAAQSIIELANGRTLQILRHPLKGGGWVATHEDITERRQIEAKIAHMAHHDVLTGLPNRALFGSKMQEALARVARGEIIAVFHLDIDRFKTINDTLGHSIGDAVLRAVTDRLLHCVRETDMIARLGGDEFAIIQTAVKNPDQVTLLAQRIVQSIGEPMMIEGHNLVAGASIGIAMAPTDGEHAEDLLQKADLALYRAKAEGRGVFRFFEPEMDIKMRERRALERHLRIAINQNQFELLYQPLVNIESGRIICLEALLRWRHPERGLVSPMEFIPLAEETGLIVPIGEWVLHEACREAANWPGGIHVSVNVSPAQFKSPNLVQTIALALSNAGLPPGRLDIEITESVLMLESSSILATLNQIKGLGVGIAMDDFGTGYSSLSYLRSFPFDKIKIDRSFIRDLANNDDCLAIVKAVTTLGESLGMSTIAEGVETQEQHEKLRAQGCDAVQGYLISPPRTIADLKPLLDQLREDAAA